MATQMTRRQLITRGGLIGLGIAAGPAFLAGCTTGSSTSAKPSTLSGLWVPYDQLVKGSKASLKSWSSSNDISVNIKTVPWADWDRTIRAFPQQPSVPDVVIADGPALQGYAATGVMKSLDKYFSKDDLADFLPGTTPSAYWKGSFYGPATNESSQALVYNKKILDKYGIKPPTKLSEAWTWPELREIMLTIQKGERKARGNNQFWGIFLGQGNYIGGATYTGLDLIRSKGAKGSNTYKAISDDGLKVSGYADTSEAMDGYQFLQDLYQSDQLSPQSASPNFFYNNQIAFWLTNPDVATSGIAQNAPTMDWGVTPHPYFVTPIVQTDSYHLAVPANSKNGDYAAELIADMVSKKNALVLAKEQAALPMRESLVADATWFNSTKMQVFSDTAREWAVPRPITPGWSAYDGLYTPMLTSIATGANIESTVKTAVEAIDKQLDRYSSYVK